MKNSQSKGNLLNLLRISQMVWILGSSDNILYLNIVIIGFIQTFDYQKSIPNIKS